MVTLRKIEALRKETGASFAEAKSLLLETDGDLPAAIALYRSRQKQETPPKQEPHRETQQEPPRQETQDTKTYDNDPSFQRQSGPTWEGHWDPWSADFDDSGAPPPPEPDQTTPPDWQEAASGLFGFFRSVFHSILHWGTANHFAVYKHGYRRFSFPLLAFVIVCFVSFWAMPFVLVGGLVTGHTYRIERK